MRVFFLQNRMKALGGKSARKVAHVHVVGAGVMGGDIAAWCASRGLTVTLQDREMKYVEPALARAREFFGKRARDPAKAGEMAARLTADIEGAGVPRADIVIEAIFENADAKRELYAKLEPRDEAGRDPRDQHLEHRARGPGAGPRRSRPPRRPAFLQPGRQDDAGRDHPLASRRATAIVEDALAFTRRLDKLPLPCRSSPGFVVNRILMPYMTEAMLAADEGVPLALIDRAAVEFGMPMGPIELADTVGLDVASHVGKILAEAFGMPVPQGTAELIAAGHLGRKSGRGYYEWRDGKPVKPETQGRAPDDLDRPARAAVSQRGGRLPARRRGRGCGPARCRHDLRHRLRAVSRRPAALRARARRARDRRAARAACGDARPAVQAGRGLGCARGRCAEAMIGFAPHGRVAPVDAQ